VSVTAKLNNFSHAEPDFLRLSQGIQVGSAEPDW